MIPLNVDLLFSAFVYGADFSGLLGGIGLDCLKSTPSKEKGVPHISQNT